MKVSKVALKLPLLFDFMEWIAEQPSLDKHGYENTGRKWCLEDPTTVSANLAARTWKLSLWGNDKTLKGIIEGDSLVVTELEGWTSDGSGILYNDVLLPLFQEFKGTLEAIVVWKSGDSVKRLTIHDGIVEDVEIV